jgi:hypothetical protein
MTLSHDLLVRTLFLELFIIFGASTIILGLFSTMLLPALILVVPSLLIATYWIVWELRRKKRRLRLCQVTRAEVLTRGTAPLGMAGSLISIDYVYYLVEICCGDLRVRYIDFEERRVGETLVVLLDHKNRVLAVAPLSRPPRIEILKKLG